MNISSVGVDAYTRIATGKQINSAADNAAGLSIVQGMDSQAKGQSVNQNNMASMNDLANTAEGALSSIHDSLGRMRELALQANNGIMSDSDKSIIQEEINQLKQGISDVAKNTEFNTMKLLDGNFADKHTAMNPDGSGKAITIESATLENFGIKDFDVTGDFSVEDLDTAIGQVSDSRSNLGSVSNAFEHAISNSKTSEMNLTSAKSQIEDSDIALEITNLKKEQLLQQYQMYTQQKKAERQRAEFGLATDFGYRV